MPHMTFISSRSQQCARKTFSTYTVLPFTQPVESIYNTSLSVLLTFSEGGELVFTGRPTFLKISLNPLTRQFYSSKGDPLGLKGLD